MRFTGHVREIKHIKEEISNLQTSEIFKRAKISNDKLTYLNSQIDRELELIQNLNSDILTIKSKADKNLNLIDTLTSFYSTQLRIEREKALNAKPVLKVARAKPIIDSNYFSYQFVFTNYGSRIADSIKYHAIFIFYNEKTDSVMIELEKANTDDHNVLTINGGGNDEFYISSDKIDRKLISRFTLGYLLVKYSYIDNMSGIIYKPDLKMFLGDISKNDVQLGQYVNIKDADLIKNYLFHNYLNYYNKFYLN
jgi:hypothetical protein